jgi:hypothetical protein
MCSNYRDGCLSGKGEKIEGACDILDENLRRWKDLHLKDVGMDTYPYTIPPLD